MPRLRAKLQGFLSPPGSVIGRYAGKKTTPEARYALAVAYHRAGRLDKALATIDGLIRKSPRDAFFPRTQGPDSAGTGSGAPGPPAPTPQPSGLAPREALIHGAYGHALLQTGEAGRVPVALRHLVEATSRDKTFATGWQQRAVAHGKLKQIGESAAALAEYYLLLGDLREVRRQVRRAERLLKPGSPSWRRIQDIKSTRLGIGPDRR